jgi:hypothetical protein
VTWCDKLASVPLVGLLYDEPLYVSGDAIIDALSPMLSKWRTGEKAEFNVVQTEPLKIDITHNNGFTYSVEPSKFSVAFQHRVKFRNVSGGKPVAELISSPQPFSQLLDSAIAEVIEAAVLLPRANVRSVKRIGIVTTTHADEQDMPPGVVRLLDYVLAPWRETEAYSVSVVPAPKLGKDGSDRCIYGLNRSEDPEQIPQFRFDWQRTLKHPIPIDKAALVKEMQTIRKAALAYFESIAIGDAYNVISDSDKKSSSRREHHGG